MFEISFPQKVNYLDLIPHEIGMQIQQLTDRETHRRKYVYVLQQLSSFIQSSLFLQLWDKQPNQYRVMEDYQEIFIAYIFHCEMYRTFQSLLAVFFLPSHSDVNSLKNYLRWHRKTFLSRAQLPEHRPDVWKRRKVTCLCRARISHAYLPRHCQTKKHSQYIKENNISEERIG